MYVCMYVIHTYIRITYIHTYIRMVYKGGPLSSLSHEPKFKQDVKTQSKHSGEDVINNMSSLMNQNLNRTQNHEANTTART